MPIRTLEFGKAGHGIHVSSSSSLCLFAFLFKSWVDHFSARRLKFSIYKDFFFILLKTDRIVKNVVVHMYSGLKFHTPCSRWMWPCSPLALYSVDSSNSSRLLASCKILPVFIFFILLFRIQHFLLKLCFISLKKIPEPSTISSWFHGLNYNNN